MNQPHRVLPNIEGLPHALYTAEQVRHMDNLAIEAFGIAAEGSAVGGCGAGAEAGSGTISGSRVGSGSGTACSRIGSGSGASSCACGSGSSTVSTEPSESTTPTLDEQGRDLTALARAGSVLFFEESAEELHAGYDPLRPALRLDHDEGNAAAREDPAVRLVHLVVDFVEPAFAVERLEYFADAPRKHTGEVDDESADISRQIYDVLLSARHSVLIQSPYMVLSRRAREVFRELRESAPELELVFSTNSLASTDADTCRVIETLVEDDATVHFGDRGGGPVDVLDRLPQAPATKNGKKLALIRIYMAQRLLQFSLDGLRKILHVGCGVLGGGHRGEVEPLAFAIQCDGIDPGANGENSEDGHLATLDHRDIVIRHHRGVALQQAPGAPGFDVVDHQGGVEAEDAASMHAALAAASGGSYVALAPKRFAARIGLAMMVATVGLQLAGFSLAAVGVAATLAVS